MGRQILFPPLEKELHHFLTIEVLFSLRFNKLSKNDLKTELKQVKYYLRSFFREIMFHITAITNFIFYFTPINLTAHRSTVFKMFK